MRRLLLAALLVLATACGGATPGAGDASGESTSTGSAAGSATADPGSAQCAAVVAGMSTRAKLAQRLMVGVDPSDVSAAVTVVRNEQVGGIFVGGEATQLLSGGALEKVQAAARVPVAVAVDDEGGRVQRLEKLDGSLPSARRMAATMTAEQVQALAVKRGKALRARGVTVNLAPVVDTGTQSAGQVIGDRSFSSDPATVIRYAGAYAAGLRESGVLPVFKHFPGHGRASGDSHGGRVTTPDLAALKKDDLRPYAELLGPGRGGVMIGHLDVPGLTGGQPATVSPKVYELLRTEYRHDGVVITDDLGAMRAISDRLDLPAAVQAALSAGADIALWSSSSRLGEVLTRLESAVRDGKLRTEQVDASVRRILAAKDACKSS